MICAEEIVTIACCRSEIHDVTHFLLKHAKYAIAVSIAHASLVTKACALKCASQDQAPSARLLHATVFGKRLKQVHAVFNFSRILQTRISSSLIQLPIWPFISNVSLVQSCETVSCGRPCWGLLKLEQEAKRIKPCLDQDSHAA